MKQLIFYIPFMISVAVQSQSYDSWKIYHNRKEVSSFNNKKETNDERRVLLLNRIMEGPGFFIVEFTPNKTESEWIRTIGFFDTSGRSIKEYNNTLFLRLHNSEIASMMDGREKVQVYSWAVPKDPAVAATVRVRRILLCTLYKR